MSKSDIHAGHRTRLKEKYIKDGEEHFEEHQLLELLLFYSLARQDTNELAHILINQFGGLTGVLNADISELASVKGIGENSALLINLVSALSRRYLKDKNGKKPSVRSIEDAGRFAVSYLFGKSNETLYVVCLNKSKQVISTVEISEGTVFEVSVYPRKIVETAILNKADSIILMHNHPGGILYPSENDINSTRMINKMVSAIGIELYDHIIVSDGKYISMKKMNTY